MKLGVTIRMSASENSVTVDGKVFDRSQMDRPTQNKLRRLIVEAARKGA